MPTRLAAQRILALLLLLPSLGACYYAGGTIVTGALIGATVGAVTTPRPLPTTTMYPAGALLLIDLSPPRDLSASMRGERDSLRVSGVTRVVGELRQTRGDTLWIAVSELRRTRGGPMSFANGHQPMTALPTKGLLRVHVITSDGRLAQRTVGGAVLGAVLAIVLLYALCANEGCYYSD